MKSYKVNQNIFNLLIVLNFKLPGTMSLSYQHIFGKFRKFLFEKINEISLIMFVVHTPTPIRIFHLHGYHQLKFLYCQSQRCVLNDFGIFFRMKIKIIINHELHI